MTSIKQERSRPILPLELEREIFEITARLYPQMAPTLLRVAQRVLVWIEPIVYETLIVHSNMLHPSLFLALESKPASFFHKNVRNLLLDLENHESSSIDRLNLLLSACTAVIDLALFDPHPSMLPHLAAMKLQRLSVHLYSLFLSHEIDFAGQPFFATITHLNVHDWELQETTDFDTIDSSPTIYGQCVP
ncbi:hypothetical protein FB451DRAFT_682518 [Mycena latifolia]|nr:hypothetical protein FB451DRAFT_682518 [Mycena latifolia]